MKSASKLLLFLLLLFAVISVCLTVTTDLSAGGVYSATHFAQKSNLPPLEDSGGGGGDGTSLHVQHDFNNPIAMQQQSMPSLLFSQPVSSSEASFSRPVKNIDSVPLFPSSSPPPFLSPISMPGQIDVALLSAEQPQLQPTEKSGSSNSNNRNLLISSPLVATDSFTVPGLFNGSSSSPENSRFFQFNLSRLDLQQKEHHYHQSTDTQLTVTGSFQPSIWRYSPVWTLALCIAYLVVFFLGLVGNLSVLWVIFILRRNSRQSMFATCNKVFNGLIGNLALADLLVIIFCLPATLISNIFTPYFLGRFMCKATVYFQGVSVSASVYTLVAISIDRFYGIYYPFNNGFSQVVRRSVIIFIWLFSLVIALPWMLFFDLVSIADGGVDAVTGENTTILMCQEVWPDELLPDLYFLVVNLGFQYLVPLSIILIFYMLLMLKIWRRRIPVFHTACRRETSTDTVDQWNARIVEQSKMKVLKMLIVIVSLFAISWLPLYLVFLHYKFGSYDEDSYFDNLVISITPLAQWLGACNSSINPVIYFFFNANFRQYLKKALTRSLLCSSSLEFTRNHIYGNYQTNNNNNHNNNNHNHTTANGHHLNNHTNHSFANGHHNHFNSQTVKSPGKAATLLNGASALLVASNTNINNICLSNNNSSINHQRFGASVLNHSGQVSPAPPASPVQIPVSSTKSSLGLVAEQVDATLRPLYCCQNGKASPSPPPPPPPTTTTMTLNTSLKLCYGELSEEANSSGCCNGLSSISAAASPVKGSPTKNGTAAAAVGSAVAVPTPLKTAMHSATTENIKTMIQFAAQSHKTLFPPKFSRETQV